MHRLELLTKLIAKFNPCTYAEIGCFDGELFRQLHPARGMAVDPTPNIPWKERMSWYLPGASTKRRYIQATSDAFFADPHPWVKKYGIQVAFIDGLHTAEQVFIDVQNTLKWLSPDGVMVLHDTNPRHAGMAYPTTSYEQAKADYRKGLVDESWSWEWCGDVWKAVLQVRMEIPGLRVHTLADDYGLTVIWREEGAQVWSGPGREIGKLVYDDLAASREEWLQIIGVNELMAKLGV